MRVGITVIGLGRMGRLYVDIVKRFIDGAELIGVYSRTLVKAEGLLVATVLKPTIVWMRLLGIHELMVLSWLLLAIPIARYLPTWLSTASMSSSRSR